HGPDQSPHRHLANRTISLHKNWFVHFRIEVVFSEEDSVEGGRNPTIHMNMSEGWKPIPF
ncbi:MAG TPA: hypothetical protein VIV82_03820, partial [Verrucomicrobiae bacterium]